MRTFLAKTNKKEVIKIHVEKLSSNSFYSRIVNNNKENIDNVSFTEIQVAIRICAKNNWGYSGEFLTTNKIK